MAWCARITDYCRRSFDHFVHERTNQLRNQRVTEWDYDTVVMSRGSVVILNKLIVNGVIWVLRV